MLAEELAEIPPMDVRLNTASESQSQPEEVSHWREGARIGGAVWLWLRLLPCSGSSRDGC